MTLTLMGAGGKMGLRIADRVGDDPGYELLCVEPGVEGQDALAERGLEALPQAAALDGADVVVMAVPDELIGEVSDEVVPDLDSGTMVLLLDPAAAYAGVLHDREDVSYFVVHPCHPPLFKPDRPAEYAEDWFGGNGKAEQDIVCALHRGPEEVYAEGETVARDIFGPVRNAHRLTTEQMALLEPALVESLAQTFIETIHEGMETMIEMGVPETAAREFLMGHLRIQIAIVFGLTEFPFSDAAQRKSAEARAQLLQEDWTEILTREHTRESVRDIAGVR